jgi:hypothetical protein
MGQIFEEESTSIAQEGHSFVFTRSTELNRINSNFIVQVTKNFHENRDLVGYRLSILLLETDKFKSLI